MSKGLFSLGIIIPFFILNFETAQTLKSEVSLFAVPSDSSFVPKTKEDSIVSICNKYQLDSLEKKAFENDFFEKSIQTFFENETLISAWKVCYVDDSLRKVEVILKKTAHYLKNNPAKTEFLKNEFTNTEKPKRSFFLNRTWWVDSLRFSCDPIGNSSGFKTLGIDPTGIKKNIILDMKTEASAPQFVELIVNSGISMPTKLTENAGYTLYKIVPKGSPPPSPFTPFWAKLEEFNINISKDFEQKFGLPVVSHSTKYDIYKIQVKEGKTAIVFESVVAATSENGYNTTGGAIQSLVLDRTKWTLPVLEKNLEIFPPFTK